MFDTNLKKLVAVIVVIGILGLGYYYFSGKGPDLDISEYPNGVKWGTDRYTVETLFDSEPNYTKVELEDGPSPYIIIYNVEDYMGIDGLDGLASLHFNENLEFECIMYQFSVDGFYKHKNQIASVKAMEEFKKGAIKAYDKIFDYSKDIDNEYSKSVFNRNWFSAESVAHLQYWENEKLDLYYRDIDSLDE